MATTPNGKRPLCTRCLFRGCWCCWLLVFSCWLLPFSCWPSCWLFLIGFCLLAVGRLVGRSVGCWPFSWLLAVLLAVCCLVGLRVFLVGRRHCLVGRRLVIVGPTLLLLALRFYCLSFVCVSCHVLLPFGFTGFMFAIGLICCCGCCSTFELSCCAIRCSISHLVFVHLFPVAFRLFWCVAAKLLLLLLLLFLFGF